MLSGFKDFLFRGNIIDLAVAVVVGTAFTALVTTLTGALIEPVINVFGGGDIGGLKFESVPGDESTTVDLAAAINALITFAITAAVVYFAFVVPSKKLMALGSTDVEPEPDEPSEEITLLREIRDALARNNPTA